MTNIVTVLLVALLCSSSALAAQTAQAPAGQKPAPATRKPAPAKPAPAKPAPTANPVVPTPASDIRFLLRQHDLKRTVQISRAANTYLIAPDTDSPALSSELPRPPGLVNVETSVADVGERKPIFGYQARRVITVIDRQPQS